MNRALLCCALAACDYGAAFDRYCERTGACIDGGGGGGGTAGGGAAGGGGFAGGGSAGGGGAGGGSGGGAGGGVACSSTCDGGCQLDACKQLCRQPPIACNVPTCVGKPPLGVAFGERVSGSGENDFWVLQNGRAHHWNGSAWGCLPGVPDTALWASGQELWAVGSQGRALHWKPGVDPTIHLLGNGELRGVWSHDGGSVWVASAEGIFVGPDGGWPKKYVPARAPGAIHGQLIAGAEQLIVPAAGGFVYVGDPVANVWTEYDAGAVDLGAAYLARDGRAWVLESAGTSRRVLARPTDGGLRWDVELVGAAMDVGYQLGGNGGGDVYLTVYRMATADGVVLRRDPLLGWQAAARYGNAPLGLWVAPNGDVITSHFGNEVHRYRSPKCPGSADVMDTFTSFLCPGWSQASGVDAVVGADMLALQPTMTTQVVGVQLARSLDLRGRSMSLRIIQQGKAVGHFVLNLGAAQYGFQIIDDGLVALVGAGAPQPLPSIDAVNGRYLRLREDAGTLFYETMMTPDAGWVELHRVAAPAQPEFDSLGITATWAGSSTTFVVDDLNACP